MKTYFSLLAAALVFTSCDNLKNPSAVDSRQEATADTAVVYDEGQDGKAVAAVDVINRDIVDLPDVDFPEVDIPEVNVRGNADYSVYNMEETVLFDTDKAAIKPKAENALKQVAASIGQRSAGKQIRIIGYADARDTKSYNKELSDQRAESVKNWLVEKGNVDASLISVQAMGEAQPVATNATPAGRQQNRRVEIVVLNK